MVEYFDIQNLKIDLHFQENIAAFQGKITQIALNLVLDGQLQLVNNQDLRLNQDLATNLWQFLHRRQFLLFDHV